MPASNGELKVEGNDIITSDVVDALVEKAKKYYRAVGRIMFHSFIRDTVVSSAALPVFYQNIILRQCNMKDGRYKQSSIVRDICAMGAPLKAYMDGLIGKKMGDFGIGDEEDHFITCTRENFMEKVILKTWVEDRSIALEALKEGVLLDGYAADILQPLRTMPQGAVSNLLFAPPTVKVDDVLNVLEPQFTVASEKILDNQKKFFEEVLKAVLRDKSKKSRTFLRNFLSFVTGLSYVPHRTAKPDYAIIVEFDESQVAEKAFPSSKTCENVLFIPFHAYHCDRKLFEEQLDVCLRETKLNNFSDT